MTPRSCGRLSPRGGLSGRSGPLGLNRRERVRSAPHPGYPARTATGQLHPQVRADARFAWAAAILFASGVTEIVAGVAAPSVPLLLCGFSVWALAIARRLTSRPAMERFTYGFGRVPHLVEMVIAIVRATLGVLAIAAAVHGFIFPSSTDGTLVLATAGVSAVALSFGAVLLAPRGDFSMTAAFQQVRTELIICLIAGVSGALILVTGADEVNAAAGLLAAIVILSAARNDAQDAGTILLEMAPEGVDPNEIGHIMAVQPGVVEVHDLHVWQVAYGFPALTAHVVVGRDVALPAIRRHLNQLLNDRFNITHVTLQVDYEAEPDPPAPADRRGDWGCAPGSATNLHGPITLTELRSRPGLTWRPVAIRTRREGRSRPL